MFKSSEISKRRRFFSLITTFFLVISSFTIGISLDIDNVSAITSLNHTNGNIKINFLTDYGRMLQSLNWGQSQTVLDTIGFGYIGLVLDQNNYDHTPGSLDIADSFDVFPYGGNDDFEDVNPINMILDNGIMQKSIASFKNTGLGTGDPDDILINQTVWTVKNKDWVILQWSLLNIKTPTAPLTNVCLGLEIPFSKDGGRFGVGGDINDGGDDIDGFDTLTNVYWVQDPDSKVTIGIGSVMSSDPITHYYGKDYQSDYSSEYKNFFENDTWLYDRLHAANTTATDGITPGNITTTIGWSDETIKIGGTRTCTLVIAINNSYNNMKTAFLDAQNYYLNEITTFQITEFSDQQIEVYNNGRGTTDLSGSEFTLSVSGGQLTGTWANNPVPPYEYAVFTRSGGVSITEEGDIIRLYENGKLLDGVSFGQKGIAPDPMIGESVARRHDVSFGGYTNEWNRNASSGPTWGYQNYVGNILIPPPIVINRVMFNPNNAVEGYVELLIRSGINRDISGYRIVCDDEFVVPQGTVLNPANKFFTFKYSNLPDFFINMAPNGDNIYLYDKNDNLLDMVGWSSSHNIGEFMSRMPDGNGTFQGYDDMSSISAGWIFNQVPEIKLTEFYIDSNSANIEVFYPRGGDIVLDPWWTFAVDSGALTGSWGVNPISEGGYSIFTMSSGKSGDEGDTIALTYKGTYILDEVSYGIIGIAPDPLVGESTARSWNWSFRGYNDYWGRDPTPTFGAQNNVREKLNDFSVVLNQVVFNPSKPELGFIELYLRDDITVNLSGFKIVGDSEFIIPPGINLTTNNRSFYLTQFDDPLFFSMLNKSGDNVYLYYFDDCLIDMVGWSSPHEINKSVKRVPDGNGTADGFNDTSSVAAGWVFNQLPELAFVKIDPDQRGLCDRDHFIWYSLNITIIKNFNDYIDITIESENNWTYELFEADQTTLVVDKEIPSDSLPDTGLLAPQTAYQIWVKIYTPLQPVSGIENTTIFARASLDLRIMDKAKLTTYVRAWIEIDTYIENPPYPTTIYEKAAGLYGLINETTITLNMTGEGYHYYAGQDVIFILDSSGSMQGNDPDPDGIPGNIPFPKRVEAAWDYVDNLMGDDRGGYVDFDSSASLEVPLANGTNADNYNYLKRDPVHGLWCCDESGGTSIYPAINLANQELVDNGDPNHVKVEILLTDAGAGNHDLVKQEADFAAANDIIIFTIGLNVNNQAGIDLLTYVANITGGIYFPAPDALALSAIFNQIFFMVGGIAGYKPNPGKEETMIRFTLDEGIEFINGSFQLIPGTFETDPNPDKVFFNPTNTILEWNWTTDRFLLEHFWGLRFAISSEKIGGNVPVNIGSESYITYRSQSGLLVTEQFPEITIEVLPIPTLAPFITNISLEPPGINISWNSVAGAELYEIYGGPNQIALNLDLPDVLGTVNAPQTWWIDSVNPTLFNEYYYVIRAVDTDTIPDTRSSTSNTGGFYKMEFGLGLNTFSLPLKPFGNYNTDWYTTNMNAEYIRFMNTSTGTWIKHNKGDGNNNNPQLKLGEGYEIEFTSDTTFIFTGMPAAMINYTQGSFVGFDFKSEAKTLSASVNSAGDIILNWMRPAAMDNDDVYKIFRFTTRDGFHAGTAINVATLTYGNESWIDVQAALPGTQYYYMIVPENEMGVMGASTYSIGIWTEEFLLGYDTFGIPLKLDNYYSADWYCDNIPDTVGINYYIYSQQRWSWHATRMPDGAFDPVLEFGEGYQISTTSSTKFTFIGT